MLSIKNTKCLTSQETKPLSLLKKSVAKKSGIMAHVSFPWLAFNKASHTSAGRKTSFDREIRLRRAVLWIRNDLFRTQLRILRVADPDPTHNIIFGNCKKTLYSIKKKNVQAICHFDPRHWRREQFEFRYLTIYKNTNVQK